MNIATLRISEMDLIQMSPSPNGLKNSIHRQLREITGDWGQIWYEPEPMSCFYTYKIYSPSFEKNFALRLDKSGRIRVMTGIARAIDIIRRYK